MDERQLIDMSLHRLQSLRRQVQADRTEIERSSDVEATNAVARLDERLADLDQLLKDLSTPQEPTR